MASGPEEPIRVGIGLIGREGSYLIRRRPPGSPMAGVWEFPGGKCEPGESPDAATARECLEEVGVRVEVGALLHRLVHRYPHGLVELHYFRCSTDGEPALDSGFDWVEAGDLPRYTFPEANDAVVSVLSSEAVRSNRGQRDES